MVVGGGGREHALCWKLRQSSRCGSLYCTPGNAGILKEPNILGTSISDIDDHDQVNQLWGLMCDVTSHMRD